MSQSKSSMYDAEHWATVRARRGFERTLEHGPTPNLYDADLRTINATQRHIAEQFSIADLDQMYDVADLDYRALECGHYEVDSRGCVICTIIHMEIIDAHA